MAYLLIFVTMGATLFCIHCNSCFYSVPCMFVTLSIRFIIGSRDLPFIFNIQETISCTWFKLLLDHLKINEKNFAKDLHGSANLFVLVSEFKQDQSFKVKTWQPNVKVHLYKLLLVSEFSNVLSIFILVQQPNIKVPPSC